MLVVQCNVYSFLKLDLKLSVYHFMNLPITRPCILRALVVSSSFCRH